MKSSSFSPSPTGSPRVDRPVVRLAACLAVGLLAAAQDAAGDGALDALALEADGRPCEALHVLRQSGMGGREADARRLRRACLGEATEGPWVDLPGSPSHLIGRFEVTVADHRACVRAGACDPGHLVDHAVEAGCNHGAAGRDAHPANCVDHAGAAEYCAWVGGRLPAAAELAAAAGVAPERPYPWGWTTPGCEVASFRDSGRPGCGLGSTAPVGERPRGAGPTGAQDLVGNVWEWTADSVDDAAPVERAPGVGPAHAYLVAGGSWEDGLAMLRADFTQERAADARRPGIGFRCVAESAWGSDTLPAGASADPTEAVRRRTVLVSAGPFVRGSERGVGDDDEFPARTLELSAFRVGRSEVAVFEYRACVLEGGCRTLAFRTAVEAPDCNYGGERGDNHPMNCVSWFGAQEYCHWAGGRLPTEAEWEKAARGVDGREFPWGNDPPHCGWANFNERATLEDPGCGTGGTWPIGSYPTGVSPWGALDLAGNLQEWVADWYGDTYYLLAPERDPPGPLTGSSRVVRGGAFSDTAPYIRAAYRYFYEPADMPATVGFRCVFEVEGS